MSAEEAGHSVTRWIEQARSDDEQDRNRAADKLWERYAAEVLRLALHNMSQRLQRRVGPEDVQLSVFATLFHHLTEGDYRLDDRDDLWGLLRRITVNKVRTAAVCHRRRRRDYRLEAEAAPAPDGAPRHPLDEVPQGGPSPDEVVQHEQEL